MAGRTKKADWTLDEIPEKIFYSIREVSEYAGVRPHVLRYWETKFSKLNPARASGNQRKYTRQDLETVFEIRDLLHEEGFTLSGAEKQLKENARRKPGSGSSARAARAEPAPKPAEPAAKPVAPAPAAIVRPATTDGGTPMLFPLPEPAPVSAPPREIVREPGVVQELTVIRQELRQILDLVS